MCDTCYNAATRQRIELLSELAELVGGMQNVRFRDDYTDDQIDDMRETGNSCLCPVNIIETLIFGGFKVWEDPEDTVWLGFFFEPVGAPPAT